MKTKALLFTCLLILAPFVAGANDTDEMPVPVKSVAPKYPADMKRDGTSGLVVVQVAINENGDVVECTVAKSSRVEFEAAALQAVQSWKFKPAKKAGVAVSAKIHVPVKFTVET